MNSDMHLLLTFMWVFMALSGALAYRTYLIIKAVIRTKKQRKKFPSLERATDKNTCTGPHSWNSITLALAGLPVDEYKVCSECGSVLTGEGRYKLNAPGLDVYKSELDRRRRHSQLQESISKKKHLRLQGIKSKVLKMMNQESNQSFDKFFELCSLEIEILNFELEKELEQLKKEERL